MRRCSEERRAPSGDRAVGTAPGDSESAGSQDVMSSWPERMQPDDCESEMDTRSDLYMHSEGQAPGVRTAILRLIKASEDVVVKPT